DPLQLSERWNEFLLQFKSSVKDSHVGEFLRKCLNKINESKELLKSLAEHQVYRLCYWQETDKEINYRRFFTINGLICLNIQNEDVFEKYHALVLKYIQQGLIQGLRIDHIDGLYNPAGYLNKLRKTAGRDAFIIVEKILEAE